MILTGCAKTSVWDFFQRKTMQEDVAGDGTNGMKCVTLTLTIPAWPKGGPLSAGSARPAKSRYQR